MLNGGKIVGFTSVIGDLLHPGHTAMLMECKQYCDYLIVVVVNSTDGRKREAVQSLFERCYSVKQNKFVDEVYCANDEKDLELSMRLLAPIIDVRFVGQDYEGKDFTGKAFCESSGINIIYNKRLHGLSSTELKERILCQK